MTFILGSNPFGSLRTHAQGDLHAALTESTGILELDFFGAPAPVRVRGGDDWQTGAFSVDHPKGGLAVYLEGLATPDGHSVDLRVSAAAQQD